MIARLHGKSIFNLVRHCQTVFQSGSTILHSHQQCKRVPVAPYPHQHLVLKMLQILAILISMLRYLIVALICTSLMACAVESLFICIFAIVFFGDKSVKVFGPFLIVFLYCWVLKSLDNSLLLICLLQIFSFHLWLVFSFSSHCLSVKKFLILVNYFFHELCLCCCI